MYNSSLFESHPCGHEDDGSLPTNAVPGLLDIQSAKPFQARLGFGTEGWRDLQLAQ